MKEEIKSKDEIEISKLNQWFQEAEEADSSLFAEQKSNVLLVNSEHYKNTEKKLRDRGLNSSNMNDKQKIKITKNHIQRIMGRYKNGIMGLSPELKCAPFNQSELSDKKAAELHQSVLLYGQERYKLLEKKEDWCADFCDIGEVAVKVFYDKTIGDIQSYQQLTSDEGTPLFLDKNGELTDQPHAMSEPSLDPMTGQMMPPEPIAEHKPAPDKDQPVYSGDFVFETILPFNLFREPEAESMDESKMLGLRKMIDIEKVKLMIPEDDPERETKLGYIQKSAETTYKIFDVNRATFDEGKGKVMLREYYLRPGSVYCGTRYPNGYYWITTEKGKLFEGELPFGVYPIAYRGFNKIQTSPRARSLVKVLRPYQYEINRAASKIVEHQLVNGDDKVITPPGGKMSQGSEMPGMRHYTAIGQPIVIPGRVGEQFFSYISSQIDEMYQVVDEMVDENDLPQQLDAYTLLFRSISRKKKYGKYAKEFQFFLKEVYWIYLRLAKHYFDDQRYIRAVGRKEAINIAEFKAADDLSVQIKLVESNEDAESMLGKTIILNQVLQYVGKDLPKEALGKVLVNMPFANSDQIFDRLTLDEKNIENDLLAMDRGEERHAEEDDKHPLYIEALTARIKSPDFKSLAPNIQQMYLAKRDEHRAMQAKLEKELLMAEQAAIPMTGNLVKVDQYVMQDGKQVRLTLPNDAITWLKSKLDQQGMTQERLDGLNFADQAAIAQQMIQGMPPQGQPMQQQQQQMPMNPNQGGMNGNGNPNY